MKKMRPRITEDEYQMILKQRDENNSGTKFEVLKDGTIYLENPVSKDVGELLERFKIDTDYWEVTKQIINEWGSEGNYNRQAKAWLQRIGDVVDWELFKKNFLDTMKSESKVVEPLKYKGGKNSLEINIFDLHLGKIAWAPETGENYDHKIAMARFFEAIQHFMKVADMYDIEEIVFPYGNDFFNSDKDYPFPQTTAGTPMDNDLRWQKMFTVGSREMLIPAIDALSTIAPVKLYGIPGNHDFQKTFYLGEVLDVYYHNNKNVTVDNSPRSRKYHSYGKNLIGFSHGRQSDIPTQRLLLLMPQEVPELWSKSKYREWHLGDIHHSKRISTIKDEDYQGITIRHMKALQGTDSWEYNKGWVGSIGGAESFVWHKENGLVANFSYNL